MTRDDGVDRKPLKDYLDAIEAAMRRGDATEHTHRPALKTLIEALAGPGVQAVNEPRRIACGAPDYVIARGTVPLGYIEAKDVGSNLNEVECSEQLARYRDSLGNLILTDDLEFRWYLGGDLPLTASLPTSRLRPHPPIRARRVPATFRHDEARW